MSVDVMVDWNNLADGLNYYKGLGYQEIDLSWTAPKDILMMTCPAEYYIVNSEVGPLVGSAEQSFIALHVEGKLNGRYVALTPCFRKERQDLWHKQTFMKVELFSTHPSYDEYRTLREHAFSYFEAQCVKNKIDEKKLVLCDMYDKSNPSNRTKESGLHDRYFSDINYNDIELGSYGLRSSYLGDKKYKWVFATGVAEPRLSTVIKIEKQKQE